MSTNLDANVDTNRDTNRETKEVPAKADANHHTDVSDTLRKIDSGPSVHNTPGQKKPKQIPVDLVEEELMESFPASDPPGHRNNNRPEPRRPGQD